MAFIPNGTFWGTKKNSKQSSTENFLSSQEVPKKKSTLFWKEFIDSMERLFSVPGNSALLVTFLGMVSEKRDPFEGEVTPN